MCRTCSWQITDDDDDNSTELFHTGSNDISANDKHFIAYLQLADEEPP